MFGRGIFGSGNFSSLDWYFSQIPFPNMIYLYKILRKEIWTMDNKLKIYLEQNNLIAKRSNYSPIESTDLTDFPELKSR
jgi:hypothetical protein